MFFNNASAASADTDGNRLRGKVRSATRGRTRDEITLSLPDGQQLVGFAAKPNRLRAGSAAVALVDARALVLALG